MVGHTFEYHPAVGVIADDPERLSRRALLHRFAAPESRSLPAGRQCPLGLAPHDLRHLLVAGGGAADHRRWVARTFCPREDVVYAKMGFKSGRSPMCMFPGWTRFKVRQITIVGSDAMLVFDDVRVRESARIPRSDSGRGSTATPTATSSSAYHHGTFIYRDINGEPRNSRYSTSSMRS